MIANTLLPARSQVSTDDELDGDIIENPAALRLGEVYIAAGEHEVPLTPTTCASATTASPAHGRTLVVQGFDCEEVSVHGPESVGLVPDDRLEDPGHGRHDRTGQYCADLDRLTGPDLGRAEQSRRGAATAGERCELSQGAPPKGNPGSRRFPCRWRP